MDCVRRSGGLLLFWKENVDSSIQSYSVGHIGCIVNQGVKQWRFTGFYRDPVVIKRKFSWQLLRRLAKIHELKHLPGWSEEILMKSCLN